MTVVVRPSSILCFRSAVGCHPAVCCRPAVGFRPVVGCRPAVSCRLWVSVVVFWCRLSFSTFGPCYANFCAFHGGCRAHKKQRSSSNNDAVIVIFVDDFRRALLFKLTRVSSQIPVDSCRFLLSMIIELFSLCQVWDQWNIVWHCVLNSASFWSTSRLKVTKLQITTILLAIPRGRVQSGVYHGIKTHRARVQ